MSFPWVTAVLLCLLGFGVGAFGTLVGAGGGFVLTPILLLLYPHDSAATLTAISLMVVFFNAASGSVAYARLRRTDYRSGMLFALATLPGAIGGAVLTTVVPRAVFDVVVGVVLGALGIWLLVGGRGRAQRRWHGGSPRLFRDADGLLYDYVVPERRGILYSLGVGFASSFLGIGGGVIHVPLLVRALGFPTHVATATSHFVLAWMAGTATIAHAVAGSFAHGHGLRRAAALSIGVVAGAQVGARLSRRVGGLAIQRLLAAALLALAIRLVLSGL